jgi:hypothetical protein
MTTLSFDPHFDGIEDQDADVQLLAVAKGYASDLSTAEKETILSDAEDEAALNRDQRSQAIQTKPPFIRKQVES